MRTSRTCLGEQIAWSDRMPVVGRCVASFAGQLRSTAAAPAVVGGHRQTFAAAPAETAGTVTAWLCSPARSGCDSRPQRHPAAALLPGPCTSSWGMQHSHYYRGRRRLRVQAVSGSAAGGAEGGQHLLSMLGQLMAGMQRQQQAAPTGSHLAVRGLSFQPAGAECFSSSRE